MIAADVMTTNPRTISSLAPIRDALDALDALGVRHLPVTDDDGNLVGMLSDRDLGPLMRTFVEGASAERLVVPLSTRRVNELMSADVVSVNEDDDVSTVVDALLDERIGAVPVVDGEGAVVGIVSYVDILRALGAASRRAEPTEEHRATGAPPRGRLPHHGRKGRHGA